LLSVIVKQIQYRLNEITIRSEITISRAETKGKERFHSAADVRKYCNQDFADSKAAEVGANTPKAVRSDSFFRLQQETYYETGWAP
jgi:hypothetical protein